MAFETHVPFVFSCFSPSIREEWSIFQCYIHIYRVSCSDGMHVHTFIDCMYVCVVGMYSVCIKCVYSSYSTAWVL